MDGKKHGKGKYTWGDENFYDGDWLENRITGYVYLIFIIRVRISGPMVVIIKENG